eukprot:CAMPEP_0180647624 /NCGR_PEP_ID=MMETSP1037_2-20121125/50441_1 /TAXON_ID=632150 /ORGANISM="Azadinium spinosum, Strain 3D9" /LENGTH=58 /DNA_ID=CAMNT_0022672199 /DNA_START=8 /DNA_END=181 /DNA_ORIENTATION=-
MAATVQFPFVESFGPADEEQAQDLKELLLHWSRVETAVFKRAGNQGGDLALGGNGLPT